jgi:hypothetical protein
MNERKTSLKISIDTLSAFFFTNKHVCVLYFISLKMNLIQNMLTCLFMCSIFIFIKYLYITLTYLTNSDSHANQLQEHMTISYIKIAHHN